MRAEKEGVWVPIYSLRLWDTARKSFGGHCGNEVGVVPSPGTSRRSRRRTESSSPTKRCSELPAAVDEPTVSSDRSHLMLMRPVSVRLYWIAVASNVLALAILLSGILGPSNVRVPVRQSLGRETGSAIISDRAVPCSCPPSGCIWSSKIITHGLGAEAFQISAPLDFGPLDKR
jgi:hypothetical protein